MGQDLRAATVFESARPRAESRERDRGDFPENSKLHCEFGRSRAWREACRECRKIERCVFSSIYMFLNKFYVFPVS